MTAAGFKTMGPKCKCGSAGFECSPGCEIGEGEEGSSPEGLDNGEAAKVCVNITRLDNGSNSRALIVCARKDADNYIFCDVFSSSTQSFVSLGQTVAGSLGTFSDASIEIPHLAPGHAVSVCVCVRHVAPAHYDVTAFVSSEGGSGSIHKLIIFPDDVDLGGVAIGFETYTGSWTFGAWILCRLGEGCPCSPVDEEVASCATCDGDTPAHFVASIEGVGDGLPDDCTAPVDDLLRGLGIVPFDDVCEFNCGAMNQAWVLNRAAEWDATFDGFCMYNLPGVTFIRDDTIPDLFRISNDDFGPPDSPQPWEAVICEFDQDDLPDPDSITHTRLVWATEWMAFPGVPQAGRVTIWGHLYLITWTRLDTDPDWGDPFSVAATNLISWTAEGETFDWDSCSSAEGTIPFMGDHCIVITSGEFGIYRELMCDVSGSSVSFFPS